MLINIGKFWKGLWPWAIGVAVLVVGVLGTTVFCWPDAIAAWAQAAIILGAACIAIQQLQGAQISARTDVFLKICEIVDSESFETACARILQPERVAQLRHPIVTSQGTAPWGTDGEVLGSFAHVVLAQFEKIGIITEHAIVDERMVADYIGDDVTAAMWVLERFIKHDRETDPTMWEHATRLEETCARLGWTREAVLERIGLSLQYKTL